MRKTALCAAFLMLTATGCPKERGDGSPEEARDAIPGAEHMKVEVPDQAGKAPGLGQVANLYLATLGTATVLNGGAALVLILAKTVVSFPVTSTEGDTYIWGPWTESGLRPGEYRMTARLNDDGDYEWRFEGRKKTDTTAPFLAIVSGVATPGRPHRGSGSFTLDFDVARAIDPFENPEDQGQISVTYDLESSPITVSMDAERLAPTPGGGSALTTFHYGYSQEQSGAGTLSFTAYGDTDDPGSDWEMSEIQSRWRADGAGRSDVTISGGDLDAGSVTATECWDSSFARVYYTDSVVWVPTEGSASACAF